MIELCERRSTDVVSIYDARQYLNIEGNCEDQKLSGLISAATSWVENYLGICLMRQKYRYFWSPKQDDMPMGYHVIYLPYPPILSVEEINDVSQNQKKPIKRLSWDLKAQRPYIMIGLHHKKVEIVYFSGYGEMSSQVPHDIRQAVLMTVQAFYENRHKELNMAHIKEILKCYRNLKIL